MNLKKMLGNIFHQMMEKVQKKMMIKQLFLTQLKKEILSIKIGDKNIDELTQMSIKKIKELRTFTLPKSGHIVSLNFLSPRIVEEMEVKVKDMKRKYKTATIDFETLVRLLTNIDTIDGEKRAEHELENIITNLPALDLQKILNNIDKLNQQVGLDNILYLTCSKCGEEISTFFRFGPEFFRPTNI